MKPFSIYTHPKGFPRRVYVFTVWAEDRDAAMEKARPRIEAHITYEAEERPLVRGEKVGEA